MYSEKFHRLLDEYQRERDITISEDQFAALVYTFPSILIAQADGRIDLSERDFIRDLPHVLLEAESDLHIDKELRNAIEMPFNEDYFLEVEYLTKHLDRWEIPFLETLREQLHNSLNERNAIFQMMWRTADSSNDISEPERQKIGDISMVLEL